MVRGLGPLLKWAIPFPETLGLRMRLAAHYVLAKTAMSSGKQFPSTPFLSQSEENIQEIDSSICASPQMLDSIRLISLLNNQSEAKGMVGILQGIRQIFSEPDIDQEARDVILDTAETFRLGAFEYLNCRFPG
jgi:hypothetical protein